MPTLELLLRPPGSIMTVPSAFSILADATRLTSKRRLPLPLHAPSKPSYSRRRIAASLPLPVENALLINIVPFLWGSYAPVAKVLSTVDPQLPFPLFNLLTYAAALATISIPRRPPPESIAPLRAGFELGFYLYVGSTLNLLAFSYTSAPRAAFLVQLTTVFVPILNSFTTQIPRRVWISCLVSLIGAAVIAEGPSLSINAGDILAVLSAMVFSIHVIRLDALSKLVKSPTDLVRQKGLAQMLLSILTLLAVTLSGDRSAATYITSFLHMTPYHAFTTVAAIIWIGACTTALATVAQVIGQARIGPSRAAVFYSTQPVWAVLLSVLAQVDTVTPQELAGGSLIVLAGVGLAVSEASIFKPDIK